MYDEMGPVDVDPRWKPIETFHDCESSFWTLLIVDLEDSFPLM